ncbi:hypothetical protein [Dactylosporangium sp. CA-139066]|uniref:hypothetical protein n=1 Tax=Dactylosporangium sp. CA-139066 TaxID=3239930 RepID=UPI003D93665C
MNAADLPIGSVAAGIDCVFLKRSDPFGDQPWFGTVDITRVDKYSDQDIDDMLRQGGITILRVGDGN